MGLLLDFVVNLQVAKGCCGAMRQQTSTLKRMVASNWIGGAKRFVPFW
jgi:hypothetical protein